MKVTKFRHACLMVEMPDRTALFDPGAFSAELLEAHQFGYLDDIIITHEHFDHMDVPTIKKLLQQFPKCRVTAPASAAKKLNDEGVGTAAEPWEGIEFFNSPHEGHEPFLAPPEQIGVHYLDTLTYPGDSHSFTETKAILALPITAPWGSTDRAVQLVLELKPRYIIPIHDWHWRDEVRTEMYGRLQQIFAANSLKFVIPVDGVAFKITP